jgi:hypothetical protein
MKNTGNPCKAEKRFYWLEKGFSDYLLYRIEVSPQQQAKPEPK